MGCKDIQELLQADYLDGELGSVEEKAVREHLLKCPACRRLEAQLRTQRAFLQSAKKEAPPERVWQNIRRAITTEATSRESGIRSVLERLRELLLTSRPVFAVATALTAIICIVVLAGAIILNQPFYAGNGEDYLAVYTLNGENGESLSNFETTLEEYFL